MAWMFQWHVESGIQMNHKRLAVLGGARRRPQYNYTERSLGGGIMNTGLCEQNCVACRQHPCLSACLLWKIYKVKYLII